VKGHDGVVEEIGMRSTKIRLFDGHQTTIPNEEMARTDIENIGRRQYLRRKTNITITYDTPLDKVEKAVQIIRDILDNHEWMDPNRPPRVYLNEFNPDSLNIMMVYWYFPPDWWDFQAFTLIAYLKIKKKQSKFTGSAGKQFGDIYWGISCFADRLYPRFIYRQLYYVGNRYRYVQGHLFCLPL